MSEIENYFKEIKSIETKKPRSRRRFSGVDKQRILSETDSPGESVSSVARRHKIAPSHLFLWRRLRDEGTLMTLTCEENVVPESELNKLKKRIRELERQLGRKTMDVEILKEGIEIARKKKLISLKKLPGEENIQ